MKCLNKKNLKRRALQAEGYSVLPIMVVPLEKQHEQLLNYAKVAKVASNDVLNYYDEISLIENAEGKKLKKMNVEQFIESHFGPYDRVTFDIWKENVKATYEGRRVYETNDNKVIGLNCSFDTVPHFCLPCEYVKFENDIMFIDGIDCWTKTNGSISPNDEIKAIDCRYEDDAWFVYIVFKK